MERFRVAFILVADGSVTVLSVFLALKLIEMGVHCYHASRFRFRNDHILKNTNGKQPTVAWQPQLAAWPFTSLFLLVSLPEGPRRFFIRTFFRWTSLMLLLSLATVFSGSRVTITLGGILLVAGIWMQILQRFVFRLKLGQGDTVFRHLAAHEIRRETARPESLSGISDVTVAADFVFLFARLLIVLILSYAAVFCGTQHLGGGTFSGVDGGIAGDFEMIYFSIVTVATVGYGDIYPKSGIGRFLVSSEILASFALFIMLLSTFSITHSTVLSARHTDDENIKT